MIFLAVLQKIFWLIVLFIDSGWFAVIYLAKCIFHLQFLPSHNERLKNKQEPLVGWDGVFLTLLIGINYYILVWYTLFHFFQFSYEKKWWAVLSLLVPNIGAFTMIQWYSS